MKQYSEMNRARIAAIASIFLLSGISVQAVTRPSFEIISIKPAQHGPRGPTPSRMTIQPGGQRFTAVNTPLRNLIMTAYGLAESQISGGPPWISTEGFDIDARTDAPATPETMHLMLQSLLADRFRLTVHQELKELAVNVLVAGEGAPKLTPAAPGGKPGVSLTRRNAHALSVAGRNIELTWLADYLSRHLARMVIDRTQLQGGFDFTAELDLDETDLNDANVSESDINIRLFTDLVQKLGLKLQPRKIPLPVVNVEHADRPDAP